MKDARKMTQAEYARARADAIRGKGAEAVKKLPATDRTDDELLASGDLKITKPSVMGLNDAEYAARKRAAIRGE